MTGGRWDRRKKEVQLKYIEINYRHLPHQDNYIVGVSKNLHEIEEYHTKSHLTRCLDNLQIKWLILMSKVSLK